MISLAKRQAYTTKENKKYVKKYCSWNSKEEATFET
jgi:hypothetical protein